MRRVLIVTAFALVACSGGWLPTAKTVVRILDNTLTELELPDGTRVPATPQGVEAAGARLRAARIAAAAHDGGVP